METHPDFGICLDQCLELLDDGMESFCAALGTVNLCNLFGEPTFEDSLILGQPSANSVADQTSMSAGHVVLVRCAVSTSIHQGEMRLTGINVLSMMG